MSSNSSEACVKDSLSRWVESRKELLVHFYRLCEMKPKSWNPLAQERLDAFCGLLIDYVSCGHFDVFEKLMQKAPHVLSDDFFIECLKSTNMACDFVDQYANTKDYSALVERLEGLGIALSDRFDLEDAAIKTIRQELTKKNNHVA